MLFVLSVGALLACATQAVRVVKPRDRDRINPGVLDTYRQELPGVWKANEHFGRKQQEILESLAESNSERGKMLQKAFWLLVAGLCLVAAQAVIIGVDRLTEVL